MYFDYCVKLHSSYELGVPVALFHSKTFNNKRKNQAIYQLDSQMVRGHPLSPSSPKGVTASNLGLSENQACNLPVGIEPDA